MSYTIFGPIVSRWDVEQATVLTLKSWLPDYLAEVAHQHPNLFDPFPALLTETVYGGVDAETWQPSLGPGVIVNATPVGDTIRFGSGDEAQWYEIRVHVLAQGGDEDHARQLVDMYGAAVMATIDQHADLATLSQNTMLIEAPVTEFIDSDERRFQQSTMVFHALVSPLVNSNAGPITLGAGVGPWPVAASANITVTEIPLTSTVPSAGIQNYPSGMVIYPEPVPDGP